MKEKHSKFYPAKILLLGEHTILHGSEAIAIPYHKYGGSWKHGAPFSSPTDLFDFGAYVHQLHLERKLYHSFDFETFLFELDLGWRFVSNIPNGSGLGSSGSFVAGIFDRYFDHNNHSGLTDVHSDLALIESYFHGNSSGLDPLVSWLDQPIKMSNGHSIGIEVPHDMLRRFELVDTRLPRQGAKMIALFMEMMADLDFNTQIQNTYIPAIHHAIEALITGDKQLFETYLLEISYFQLVRMNAFIPVHFISQWEQALASGQSIYKICGAGGGGYLLKYQV